jgi:RNA polymerase sigma-70 factor (ECF subfamily)
MTRPFLDQLFASGILVLGARPHHRRTVTMPATPSARFPATAWSCIEAARDRQHPDFVLAVNRLVTTYWRPVFYFLRRKYPTAADHEVVTQDFFHTLVTRDWLARVDPSRGRFRDFLKTLLHRFAYDQVVRPPRQARFEQRFVSIHDLVEDSDRAYDPPDGETPGQAFDRAWKAALLQTVRRNLEVDYAAAIDPEEKQRFAIFAALHLAQRDEDRPSQEAVAERFGISRDQVRYAVEQVKKRYERLLRQEVRDQVGADVDVDEEIRKLMADQP